MKFECFKYLYDKVIVDFEDEITPFLISLWTTDCEDCEPEDIADLERKENYMLNVTTWDGKLPKLYSYNVVADKDTKVKVIEEIFKNEYITYEDICFLEKYFKTRDKLSVKSSPARKVVDILDRFFYGSTEKTYQDIIVLASILRIKPYRPL